MQLQFGIVLLLSNVWLLLLYRMEWWTISTIRWGWLV